MEFCSRAGDAWRDVEHTTMVLVMADAYAPEADVLCVLVETPLCSSLPRRILSR